MGNKDKKDVIFAVMASAWEDQDLLVGFALDAAFSNRDDAVKYIQKCGYEEIKEGDPLKVAGEYRKKEKPEENVDVVIEIVELLVDVFPTEPLISTF